MSNVRRCGFDCEYFTDIVIGNSCIYEQRGNENLVCSGSSCKYGLSKPCKEQRERTRASKLAELASLFSEDEERSPISIRVIA